MHTFELRLANSLNLCIGNSSPIVETMQNSAVLTNQCKRVGDEVLRVVRNNFGSLSRCSGMHTFRLRLANSFYLCISNSGSNGGISVK